MDLELFLGSELMLTCCNRELCFFRDWGGVTFRKSVTSWASFAICNMGIITSPGAVVQQVSLGVDSGIALTGVQLLALPFECFPLLWAFLFSSVVGDRLGPVLEDCCEGSMRSMTGAWQALSDGRTSRSQSACGNLTWQLVEDENACREARRESVDG